MSRTPEQTARLQTLSRELRKVPPESFNINCWADGNPQKLGCGTAGCALGWCVKIFPDDWRFMDDFEPILASANAKGAFSDAEKFFGLTYEQSRWLFSAFRYRCPSGTTGSDVADRIDQILTDAAVGV